MLPKKNRLTRLQIDQVKQSGTVVHSRYWVTRYIKSPNDTNQHAIVISRKLCPKASSRNYLKRFCYAHLSSQNQITHPLWSLHYLKQSPLNTPAAALVQDLITHHLTRRQ